MATANNLIELILNLLKDPAALAAFNEDPEALLAACGASEVSPDDVHDALVLADDQDADFSRDHGHHVPPPPAPHPGESDHEAAVRYIKTVVTNNYYDERQTIVDNSVNQQIDTGGGDFDQNIDIHNVTASGDGAVAAGDDIEGSTVTTGNGNQIGDGNIKGDNNVQGQGNHVVNGDDNTTAFGEGAANSASIDHVNVDDGGALAVGGSAQGVQQTEDSHDVNETTTTTEFDHSGNVDIDAADGSYNDTDTDVSTDSHDHLTQNEGSFNTLDHVTT